jgi:hypothetical protein
MEQPSVSGAAGSYVGRRPPRIAPLLVNAGMRPNVIPAQAGTQSTCPDAADKCRRPPLHRHLWLLSLGLREEHKFLVPFLF